MTRGGKKSRDEQKPVGLADLSAGNWDTNSVRPEPSVAREGRRDGERGEPAS